MPTPKHQQSIVDTLTKTSPLYLETQKPQLMFVTRQNYGVRKLWKRIDDNKRKQVDIYLKGVTIRLTSRKGIVPGLV